MKNALIIEEQIHQKQKPQEQLYLSTPSLPPEQQQKLGLEDISPIWASRLKKATNFYVTKLVEMGL
ncbi:MAG TPA: hypothetical protein VKA95_06360 [Nitrososphaeraceae archaeon]|nr:hypothetical protein [Nitrososphaeraceae archaeon]